MIVGGGFQAEHTGHGLVAGDEDAIDVVGPGALGGLELDDVSVLDNVIIRVFCS